MEEKSYKEYLKHITTFIFDIDGVLTDGTVTVTTSGELLRNMSIKDGYALKTAVDLGYTEPDPKIDLCGVDVSRKILCCT